MRPAFPVGHVHPRIVLIALAVAAVGAAQPRSEAACYRLAVTAPASFSLPGGTGGAGDFRRSRNGAWLPLSTRREAGKPVSFTLSPTDGGPTGDTLVVLGKPDWMVLDDTSPPRVAGVTVNGQARPAMAHGVALGMVNGDRTEVRIALADDLNPLAADGIGLDLTPDPGEALQVDRSGLTPGQREGGVTIRLNGLAPGTYRGELVLSDMAPAANRAVVPVEFCVFGVSISADRQSVVLAGAGAEFRLQAHLSEQLLLPGGTWAKLTTRTGDTWLYPRQFTDVALVRDEPLAKTVLVKANTQDLDGKPVDGLGALEYELTVRADTPALLVTTRSLNLSGRAIESNANWGWLPAAYYVTPAGRQDWRGQANDRYVDVGRVGWLWLAPAKANGLGLAWMSPLRFGESRFDTMLLYSEAGAVKAGASVGIRFAIAPAESPEAAAALYKDLVARGLLAPPPAIAGD